MTVNSFENQLKVIEFSFFLYLILQDYKILCFCCNTDDCMNQEKGLEQIQIIQQIIERSHEYQQPCVICFVDYTKAFDSIDQERL